MSRYDKESVEKFRLSGRILRDAREEIRTAIHENIPIIEICEKSENIIRQKGGQPAFPCNVSINEVAAHFTSPPHDERRVPINSVVKIDLGVHVDGYVTDTAFTVCFNSEHAKMVEAAEHALKTAIENISADMPTSKIGGLIENAIKNLGFKPISNLTGHSVGRYLIHAGTSIPNVSQLSVTKLKAGEIYAVEPFVTLPEADGRVEDGTETTIFRLVKAKSLRNQYAKRLLKHIETHYKALPFAERWLSNLIPEERHGEAFKELLQSRTIIGYPVFVESSGKPVTQAEHTVLVTSNACEVLT